MASSRPVFIEGGGKKLDWTGWVEGKEMETVSINNVEKLVLE